MLRHNKINNKEIRNYLQGLRPFKTSIPKNVKKILNKKNDIFHEILGKWSNIVGKKISNLSCPAIIKFSKDNKNNSLTVTINKGSEIEIEYSKNIIIEKINNYFGYNLIKEIILKSKLITSNKKNKNNFNINKLNKISKKINGIKNDKIKLSLERLISELKKNV